MAATHEQGRYANPGEAKSLCFPLFRRWCSVPYEQTPNADPRPGHQAEQRLSRLSRELAVQSALHLKVSMTMKYGSAKELVLKSQCNWKRKENWEEQQFTITPV